MNRRQMLVSLAALWSFPVLAATNGESQQKGQADCLDTANTQRDLNQCASSKALAAETAMQAAYTKLLRRFSHDPVVKHNLVTSQLSWEGYRKAQMKLLYSHYGDAGGQSINGSSTPMCFDLAEQSFFEMRRKELERLTKTGEGDVCAFPFR